MVIEEVIRAVTPEGWHVRVEQPVRLPDHDEPEPDLAIVRGRPDTPSRTVRRRPGHRGRRLIERWIEVYSDPISEGYGTLDTHEPSSDIALLIEGQKIGRVAAGDLLPEPKTS